MRKNSPVAICSVAFGPGFYQTKPPSKPSVSLPADAAASVCDVIVRLCVFRSRIGLYGKQDSVHRRRSHELVCHCPVLTRRLFSTGFSVLSVCFAGLTTLYRRATETPWCKCDKTKRNPNKIVRK